jgi:transposase
VYVVDPGRTKAIGAKLIKNDKLDARVLAVLCQADLMATVHRPSLEQRLGRMPVAARDALVRSRSQLMNNVRSLLDSEGISIPGSSPRYFPGAVLTVLDGPEVPEALATAVKPVLEAIERLTESIRECDAFMEEAAANDPVIQRLKTVPGVGPITAAAFVYAVRDPSRFQSGRQVGAYLGLVPSLYSSGQTHRVGRITKQGSRQTRWLLTMAANALLRARPSSSIQLWGQALAERVGRRKAIVAIARKLASALWAIWRREGVFEPRLMVAK